MRRVGDGADVDGVCQRWSGLDMDLVQLGGKERMPGGSEGEGLRE